MNSATLHKNIDIVCFSLSRWDAEISSPAVALAKEFAKTNRVFFIGHPYTWKDVFAGKRKKCPKVYSPINNLTVIDPPVTLPVNFLPEGYFYRMLFGINQKLLEKALRSVLKNFNVQSYLFINFFDPFYLGTIPSDIRPVKYVYQCMDDMSQVAYTRRHGVALENKIIAAADLVLCTSKQLARIKSTYSANVYVHPNAADFDLFNSAARGRLEKPVDLEFSGKKIIGFTGSVEYRTDFVLLKKIAAAHSDKIIFLLGPVSGDEHIRNGLQNIDNIIFDGPRDIVQLPAYLQHFDCCIIPYKINTLTASIYPLKINEYLAAGKPVVTTAFSEDILSFSEVIYVARSHDEFVRYIDDAIENDDEIKRAARIEAAASNTWTTRVQQFWELVT